MSRLTDHRLATCICIAVVVHLCVLLVPWQPDSEPPTKTTTLHILLSTETETPVDELPVENPEQAANGVATPEQSVASREISDTEDLTQQANGAKELAAAALPNEDEEQQPKETIPRLDRQVLVSRVKANLNLSPAPYRTFSRDDFVAETKPFNAEQPAAIPLMIASATAVSQRSAAGQSTDLIRRANGDAMCWQQRGIPGETQQWYRVPLALCGHLNKP